MKALRPCIKTVKATKVSRLRAEIAKMTKVPGRNEKTKASKTKKAIEAPEPKTKITKAIKTLNLEIETTKVTKMLRLRIKITKATSALRVTEATKATKTRAKNDKSNKSAGYTKRSKDTAINQSKVNNYTSTAFIRSWGCIIK